MAKTIKVVFYKEIDKFQMSNSLEIFKGILKIHKRLDHIEQILSTILNQEAQMSAELDRLTTEVSETKGAIDSAIILIQGLADYIRAHANDPAALTALADSLDAEQALLAIAVANNPLPPTP